MKGAKENKEPQPNDQKDLSLSFKPFFETYKKSFPDPNKYDTYFEYEQAVLDWKIDIEASIGYLQLPNPVGRTYSRPKVSLEAIQV